MSFPRSSSRWSGRWPPTTRKAGSSSTARWPTPTATREGFGLTVSEALWKARPFVGGAVGGIPLQVRDGETGYLVSSPDQCADRAVAILRDPDLGRRLGRTGKEHVRQHF